MKKVKISMLIILCAMLGFLISTIVFHKKQTDPDKSKMYFTNGKKYFTQGEFEKAVESYRSGIKFLPDKIEGMTHEERILRGHTTPSAAYNLLGMSYRNLYNKTKNEKYLKRAISSFKKSIRLDNKNWYPLVNLGTTYFYMVKGKRKKCIPYFEKSIDIYPENPDAANILKLIEDAKKEK